MTDVNAAAHVVEVLEGGQVASDTRGVVTCTIGSDLRFDRGLLEQCSSSYLGELDVDLLVVLGALAFADRRVSRRAGHRWGRQLSVSVPVYAPEVWERATPSLVSLLQDVSGDSWALEFRGRVRSDGLTQLFLPQLRPDYRGGTVVPYSGGLDSLATIVRHRLEYEDTPLLLVHARHGGRSLHSVLPDREHGVPAMALPFTIAARGHAEPSYRTRTLIFFSLAALAWRMNNARRIWIGESGVGCFGPSFVPFGVEQPARTCHPALVAKLQNFLVQLWGVRPPFEFPNMWITKGEALREVSEVLNGWQRTQSCSRNVRRQHPSAHARQCGVCSNCLFRRQSLLVAGLAQHESPRVYYADVLTQPELPVDAGTADREVATYAVVGLDELANCWSKISEKDAHVVEIAASVSQSQEDVALRLQRLLRQHAGEWHSLLSALPQNSWVARLASHQSERSHDQG